MSKLVAAVALVAVSATVAAAEPNVATTDEKDPGVAIGMSLGGTLGSVGLIALGAALPDKAGGPAVAVVGALSLLVTPSLGEFYSGQYLTAGMGMRAGGVLAFGVGAAEALSNLCFDFSDDGHDSCSDRGTDVFAIAMLGLGATSFIAGTIYDIATAGDAAERYNNKHNLAFAPTVIQSKSGATTGFALSGTF